MWNEITLLNERRKAHEVHSDRINVMNWVGQEEWLITGDKKGKIVVWDNKLSHMYDDSPHTSVI